MVSMIRKYYPVFINIYSIWMLYMLFFADMRQMEYRTFELRTIPFGTIDYYFSQLFHFHENIEFEKNVLGNIILFIPYGFLGILYPKLNQFQYLLLVFVILINIIEFSQYYFDRGTADIDDVILNTTGVIIGFMIYKIILRTYYRKLNVIQNK